MATHHGYPHHPTTPATPASPPSQWQPLNWSFPFAPISGNEADPQTWLSALSNADGGFYPLGLNGMYHGGIHFDAGTGGRLKQGDGVKAIADGEVVAYRLDSTYPELTYPTTPPRYVLYSTGFVLVRHKLVLPPEPKPAGSPAGAGGAQAPRNDQPPADEVLELYSLYMHQLDWAGYKAAEQADSGGAQSASAIHRSPFWEGDRLFRVGAKAKDKVPVPPYDPADASQNPDTPRAGTRICDRASGTIIGLLPRGGELSIVGNTIKGWAQIATITKGTPVAAIAGGTPDPRAAKGWVNLDELDAVIDPKPLDTVVVLDKPFPVKAGDVVGYLGQYRNSTEASVLPPQRIRPLLHVEVITGAQINDFIRKSQERANKLGDKVPAGKPLLVIQQGAKLVKPADPQGNSRLAGLTLAPATGKQGDPGKGIWAKVQPTKLAAQPSKHGHGDNHPTRGTPVGDPLWVERTKYAGKVAGATVPTWATFPLQLANAQGPTVGYQQVFSRAQLDQGREIDRATDDQGTQWWSITAADDDGKAITRWVCEKSHPCTRWESPWAWPGFDTVDTAVPLFDMYRRNLFETKQLLNGEEQEFSVVAAKVNASPFIAKLEKAAKRKGSDKGDVVPADLKRALTMPWLAEAVSHLIFCYESEWGGDMGKWGALSSIMGEDGKPIWQAEMERIEKLQWWEKVNAVKGFPADPNVWHIHPIALVGNFLHDNSLITLAMLKAVEPSNSDEYYQTILPYLNKYALAYQVNKPKRIAHFLSQAAHESKLRSSEEGLNYNPKNMRKTFGCKGGPKNYESSCDDCAHGRLRDKLWSEENYYAHNPEHLANYVYANRMGNGDERSGDGYKYRGRGFIQVTGKAGYQSFQDEHNRRSPDDQQDFIENPDLIATHAEYAVESAFVFWSKVSLNSVSDAGTVADVTQIVNGGQTGYGDRLARYNAIAPLLGLATE
ncbi:glycoside hydrolase family 19 protein [Paraburkholderia diazotrophica]|uniref:Predicted chitinase n=1 Tax=Paraburkholderia diazotrophica TaxID=667676 RepID=A0A1H6RCP4_9BURK|nr:muramidase [Paraburkholderia diazotrophica]SEI49385.1 Predicted chitinase [Paraburkholderia diazotrophica]